MRPKYYDFEGYGFDEFMVVSRARREKDRAEMRRANRKTFAARHKENWDDDDWDDDDFDDDDSVSSFSRFRR